MQKNHSFTSMKESMPAWKRKKDPILTKVFYRPLSFWLASICANHGVRPNTISYISTIVGIISCALFLIPKNFDAQLIGAVLVNVWIVMDCIDGNLARGYMRQPFGEFADGTSSYILVGYMCTAWGFAAFFDGGLLINAGCPWIVLLGAIASSSDALMRLVYQKYKNVETDMITRNIIDPEPDKHTDHSQVGSFRSRIENELGLGGLLPCAILIATIFHALDIIVIYCFFYYGTSALIGSLIYFRKAIIATGKYQNRMPQS